MNSSSNENGVPYKLRFDLMCLLVEVCSRAHALSRHRITALVMD